MAGIPALRPTAKRFSPILLQLNPARFAWGGVALNSKLSSWAVPLHHILDRTILALNMMQLHKGYWISGSAVPGPPYTIYWEILPTK